MNCKLEYCILNYSLCTSNNLFITCTNNNDVLRITSLNNIKFREFNFVYFSQQN